jgi:hypothetical protein
MIDLPDPQMRAGSFVDAGNGRHAGIMPVGADSSQRRFKRQIGERASGQIEYIGPTISLLTIR